MKNRSLCSWKEHFSFFMAAPAILWQLLFLCIPILVIVGLSFISSSDTYFPVSLSNYSYFFDLLYFKIIGRSFVLALFNTIFCFLCAYPVAYYVAFNIKYLKNIILFFLLLPFWTNLLVLAYAWFFVLEKYGAVNTLLLKLGLITSPFTLLNTYFAVYIVMLYCYLPFMIFPIYTILEKMDRRLIEASLDLGATPLQTFLNITFPLSLSGVRTGFFLVFIPSFGEFVIPSLLGGDKEFFAGSLIAHYFLVSRNQYLGSAFTCLCGILLGGVSFVIYRLFARARLLSTPAVEKGYLYEKE